MTIWGQALTALEPLRDVRVLVRVAVWSAVIWLLGIAIRLGRHRGGRARCAPDRSHLRADGDLDRDLAPVEPGLHRVFQLVGQQALAGPFPVRFDESSALAIVVLFHAIYYVVSMALGAIGMARLGLSLRSVRSAERLPRSRSEAGIDGPGVVSGPPD